MPRVRRLHREAPRVTPLENGARGAGVFADKGFAPHRGIHAKETQNSVQTKHAGQATPISVPHGMHVRQPWMVWQGAPSFQPVDHSEPAVSF